MVSLGLNNGVNETPLSSTSFDTNKQPTYTFTQPSVTSAPTQSEIFTSTPTGGLAAAQLRSAALQQENMLETPTGTSDPNPSAPSNSYKRRLPFKYDSAAIKKKLLFTRRTEQVKQPEVIVEESDQEESRDGFNSGGEEEFVGLFPESTDKPCGKKTTVKDQMLEYFLKYNLMSPNDVIARPITEIKQFLLHPQYNTLCSSLFDMVRATLVTKPFMSADGNCFFTPLSEEEYEAAIEERDGEKIEFLLKDHHGISEAQFKTFLQCMCNVADKKMGKENSIWLQGKSNAGKSILLDSFMEYFRGAVGAPANNVRSGFPLGDCTNVRVIRWDEPAINMDNCELAKSVMGGNDTKADKKYSCAVTIPRTPVFISSNKPLWALCLKERVAFENRMAFHIYLTKPCPDNFGNLTKMDWDIVLTKYYLQYKLATYTRNLSQRGTWRLENKPETLLNMAQRNAQPGHIMTLADFTDTED
jgi:hypothetical protein